MEPSSVRERTKSPGKLGSIDNPEVVQDVPGHVIPILEREFDAIDPAQARVLLLHGGDRVLPSFSTRLSASAQRTLDSLGVETHLGVHVTGVGEDHVETTRKADGTKNVYPARTTLWTTGVEAVPFATTLARSLGVEQDRGGRIPVEDDLSVPGHPDIFVCGDMSSYRDLPGVAEVAMQGGHHAGAMIATARAASASSSSTPGRRSTPSCGNATTSTVSASP